MASTDLSEEQQKRVATEIMLDAWDEACARGVSSDLLAEVLIYLAVTDLVADRGEEWTADTLAALPERIRAGEFTLEPPEDAP